MNQYRHLAPFPENRARAAALKRRGIRAGMLSNGDPDMLAELVAAPAFRAARPGAERAKAPAATRPTRRPTRSGRVALGLHAREILFVSSNCWDAIGATWYGYTTLWVNRAGRRSSGSTPNRRASAGLVTSSTSSNPRTKTP